jgi:AraC-like DNA-binding protein
MKIYPLIDSLSHEKDFYAVLKFMQLLHELSMNIESATPLSSSSFARAVNQSDSRRVKKIETYINNNYNKKLRLNDMANLVGMTPVAFSKFFKIRTGKSVMKYIIDMRLGFAARMLVDSTMSVVEISYDCGFNNISNFNRIFKKNKGCSPKEFRNMYKTTKKQCLI